MIHEESIVNTPWANLFGKANGPYLNQTDGLSHA